MHAPFAALVQSDVPESEEVLEAICREDRLPVARPRTWATPRCFAPAAFWGGVLPGDGWRQVRAAV